MQNLDPATLKTILTIRLSEYSGPYTPAAVAEYVIAVITEAGLLATEARNSVLATDGHAPLVVAVLAEALRANLGETSLSLATAILVTLHRYSIDRIAPTAEVHLSQRQRQSLALYAQGNSYDEISTTMGIAYDTVKTHLDKAREALGARNSVHAAVKALTMGLIEPGTARTLAAA